ncbi:hypothetical protein HYV12_03140 [Candidatus Dojkabacteria bacterium]|nr:hypothetical protein [Candidatus Dojkabacteria bacterium]
MKNKNLITIISIIVTLILLVSGYFLYRSYRSQKFDTDQSSTGVSVQVSDISSKGIKYIVVNGTDKNIYVTSKSCAGPSATVERKEGDWSNYTLSEFVCLLMPGLMEIKSGDTYESTIDLTSPLPVGEYRLVLNYGDKGENDYQMLDPQTVYSKTFRR